MRVIDAPQRSPAWFDARLGKPTASRAADFAARTKRGAPTAARAKYAYQLVAERLAGPQPQVTTAAMQRGIDQEPDVLNIYELRTGERVVPVGFVTDDDGRWGASPDGLVGDAGMVECKTTAPHLFVADILDAHDTVPDRFRHQLIMQMLVAERDWCDLVQYCAPLGAARIIRYMAVPSELNVMESELVAFAAEVDDLEARALDLMADWSVTQDLDDAATF